MIKSPVLRDFLAKGRHRDILICLERRFGRVPHEVEEAIRAVVEPQAVDQLMDLAVGCPDLAAFRAGLPTQGQ